MPYATQAALEDAFGVAEILQVADRDGDGEADEAVLAAALARADATIDGYLGARYATPVAPPPLPILTAMACDLARYWLYDDAAPDRVREGYEDALAWLREVAAGKVALGLPPAAAPLTGSPRGAAAARAFTRESTQLY